MSNQNVEQIISTMENTATELRQLLRDKRTWQQRTTSLQNRVKELEELAESKLRITVAQEKYIRDLETELTEHKEALRKADERNHSLATQLEQDREDAEAHRRLVGTIVGAMPKKAKFPPLDKETSDGMKTAMRVAVATYLANRFH